MQQKQEKLYTELKKFYTANRLKKMGIEKYQSEFLFKKDSHTFREIIYRAAVECIKNKCSGGSQYKEYVDMVAKDKQIQKSGDEDEKKKSREELKEKAKDIYDTIFPNDTKDKKQESTKSDGNTEKTLTDFLSFYGAVEKDFSAIADPSHVGLTQFWRVINYFWAAFFTILKPVCVDFGWYKYRENNPQDFYSYVLENLMAVINDIYTKYDYKRTELEDIKDDNYYAIIHEAFPDCTAITTNYTPFVEHYFSHDKSIYLAGRLSEFEYPSELTIKDLSDEHTEPIKETDFIFPFLMTQAPIKPIISPIQIKQYDKAIEAMSDSDTLVIIGYSLGQADDHINAMIREYVKTMGKKLVFCYYDADGRKDDVTELRLVRKSIKLDKGEGNIQVVRNMGNATDLVKEIKSKLI